MRVTMLRYLTSLTTLAAMLLLTSLANASRTGIQWIGLANYTDAGVNSGVSALLQAGGDLEATFLPFNFNPNSPFGNADKVVQRTLPTLNGSLTMTVYLGFREGDNFPDDMFNWSLFQQGRGTDASRLAYLNSINWQARLDMLDNWIASTRSWANGRGLGGKLHITVVPMLEDNCPDSATYSCFLDIIARYQQAKGVSVPYRRSFEGNSYFRVGNLPLEYHGGSPSGARPGDVYSNDGAVGVYSISADTFIASQRGLLQGGVSCLWWRSEWNGIPPFSRSVPTSNRVNLNPFSKDATLLPELIRVISSR